MKYGCCQSFCNKAPGHIRALVSLSLNRRCETKRGASNMILNLNCLEVFGESYTPEFVWVKDKSFDGQKIVVDNHLYARCKFVDCNFVYSGSPFGFDDCELVGGYLSLTGAGRRVSQL